MRVKLLKDVTDGDTGPLKVSKRRNKSFVPPEVGKDAEGRLVVLKEAVGQEHRHVPFIAGAVVEVSDTTGAKWIERGLAEEVKS